MDDFQLLLGILVAGASSAITQAAKRWQWADDFSRALCVMVGGLCGLLLWALAGAHGEEMQTWLMTGFGAGGLAVGAVNMVKTGRKKMRAPAPAKPKKRASLRGLALVFLLAAPLAAQERLRLENPLVPLNAWQLFDDGEASAGPPAPAAPSRMAPGLLCSREGACEPIIDFSLMRKPSSLMPGRWLSLDVLGGENRLGLGAALDLFGAKGEDGKLPRLRIGLAMSGEFDWTNLLGTVAGDPEEDGDAPAAERVYQLGVWLAMGLE